MKKKQVSFAIFAMLVLVIPATTSCTQIVGIDQEYHLRKEPQPVADNQLGANYVAVDATNVYWTNRADGRVMKKAIDGGGEAIAIATGQNEPRCIAVDATHVYWTNVGDGTVKRVAIDGPSCDATACPLLAEKQNNPYDIVVNDEFIFWTNEGTRPPEPADPPVTPALDGSIMRLERYKTDPIPVPPAAPTTLVPSLNYPQAIAVYETSVYWTDVDNLMKTGFDGVKRIPVASLPQISLHTQFSDIAVNSQGVFWTNTDTSSVNKVGITGFMPLQLAADTQTPFGIAVDATAVYWTNSFDGIVMKVGIDGGKADKLAEMQAYPVGIAVDETCVYWANRDNGTIMKREK